MQLLIDDRISPVDLEPGSTPVLRWRIGETDMEYGNGAQTVSESKSTGDECKAQPCSGGCETQTEPNHRENEHHGQSCDDSSLPKTTAYQVLVTDNVPDAASGNATIWDSGKCEGDGFGGVDLSGVPMIASRRYWVSVRLWDGEDRVSPWSVPMTFGTGAGRAWLATPIWAEPPSLDCATRGIGDTSIDDGNSTGWAFLRSELTLPDTPIRWATLNVTAASTAPARQFVYRAWLNGEFVGCGPVFPTGSQTRYDGFDVTRLLVCGQANVIGALAYTMEDQRFAAQLDIGFENGTIEHYGTCSDWKAIAGSRVYPDSPSIGTQYFEAPAENLQAQHYPFGFATNGFDASSWPDAQVKEPFASYETTPTNKVAVRYFKPKHVRVTPQHHVIMDFGVAWVGGIRMRVNAALHTDIVIRYGEVLDDDGSVKYHLSAFNTYEDIWHLCRNEEDCNEHGCNEEDCNERSCGGQCCNEQSATQRSSEQCPDTHRSEKHQPDGHRSYEQCSGKQCSDGHTLETWGIRVFRYVEFIATNPEISLKDLLNDGSLKIESAALIYPQTASMNQHEPASLLRSTSQLESATHAASASQFESMSQEAPARQCATFTSSDPVLNSVWELSAHTIEACNGNIYNDSWTRERAPYEADVWIQQHAHLTLDDEPTLGRYSIDYLIANRTWPTEWPLYLIMAVYESWRHTGEIKQIRKRYEALKYLLPERFFDPTSGFIVKDPGESSHMDGDLVDWPQSERDGFVFGHVNTVINALASQAYADMAQMAQELRQESDAELFCARARTIRRNIHQRLYDSRRHAYADGIEFGRGGVGDSSIGMSDTVDAGEASVVSGERGASNDPELRDGSCDSLIRHYSLHASAFVLAYADIPDDRVDDVTEYLRERGMACSVYAAATYLDGLYRAGCGSDANALIGAKKGLRTWHNMLSQGAGATMEAWDISLKPNTTYSHPWAASPLYLLAEGLFGIRPIRPGYREFAVMPQPGDVQSASITVPVRTGDICVRYRIRDACVSGTTGSNVNAKPRNGNDSCIVAMDLDITVPDRTLAHVVLPPIVYDADVIEAMVDGMPRSIMPTCATSHYAGVRCPAGSVHIDGLGPGEHHIEV